MPRKPKAAVRRETKRAQPRTSKRATRRAARSRSGVLPVTYPVPLPAAGAPGLLILILGKSAVMLERRTALKAFAALITTGAAGRVLGLW